MDIGERICPGCGVGMPLRPDAAHDNYDNASPECWSTYAGLGSFSR
jgi:hypothetical protein